MSSAPQTPTPPLSVAASTTSSGSGFSGSNKNEIKVSAEGVAKLTFNFLDEQGDSSLEPGEVKTPPHGSVADVDEPLQMSEAKAAAPMKLEEAPLRTEVKTRQLVKSASQLEAEMCEEKVRAILELDAIKRREEVAKRKQQSEKRSDMVADDEESKKKAKEERKRLKRLKREQKAARLALMSGEQEEKEEGEEDDDDEEEEEGVIKSSTKKKKDFDSFSSTHSTPERSDELLAALPRFPYPGMYGDPGFMGFRPMGPFMRGMRPDFHHGRGGFMPRGRGGGMRGNMRFPGYRPPFFAAGGMPLRHHGPIPQRMHTPPPARGHSPVQPPQADLLWTKSKPSISYAFNSKWRDSVASKAEQKHKESLEAKSKSHKKSKKHEEREKVKKRRSSRNSSEKSSKRKIERIRKSLATRPDSKPPSDGTPEPEPVVSEHKLQRTLAERQSLKEVKKIGDQPEISTDAVLKFKTGRLEKDMLKEITPPLELIKDAIGDQPEISTDAVLKIKTEKLEKNVLKEITPPLVLIKDTIKSEPGELIDENGESITAATADSTENKVFDMFAESPPRSAHKHASKNKKTTSDSKAPKTANKSESSQDFHTKLKSAITSPKETDGKRTKTVSNVLTEHTKLTPKRRQNNTPPLTPPLSVTSSKLQEIQKRIGQLLEEDDLPMATIQATKEMLMKKNLTKEKQKAEETSFSISKDRKRSPIVASERPRSPIRHKQDSPVRDKHRSPVREKHRSPAGERSRHSPAKRQTRTPVKDKPFKEKKRQPSPEEPKRRNPFKRSISRDRYFGKIDRDRRSNSRLRVDERERGRPRERRSSSRPKGKSSKETERCGRVSQHLTKRLRNSLSSERERDRERGSNSSLNKSISKERDKSDSRRRDLKRRLSKSPLHHQRARSKDKNECKESKSATPPLPSSIPESGSEKHEKSVKEPTKAELLAKRSTQSKKKRTNQPLSFTAAEFLFPEDTEADALVDEEVQNSPKTPKLPIENIFSSKNSKPAGNALKKRTEKDDSPDTDDYLDNWENLDADVDANSNAAGETLTPVRPSHNEVDVARFVNPSPPMELLQLKQSTPKVTAKSTTPSTPPLVVKPKESQVVSDEVKDGPSVQSRELFGMQELYDQFIKSVEESGVDMKAATPKRPKEVEAKDLPQDQSDDHLSTTSTSSTSSSSSSTSSSDASSSSSSSGSSSSASSSEDSNDTESFEKTAKASPICAAQSPELKDTADEIATVAPSTKVTPEKQPQSSLPASETPPIPTTPKPSEVKSLPAAPPTEQAPSTPVKEAAPATPAKAQKSDVAKDFKKLKSLEANLARIQMMRANYDSADEISEELLKMEKLFLQEKNLILQKYAKSSSTTTTIPQQMDSNNVNDPAHVAPSSENTNATVAPSAAGQFVQSLQETPVSEPPASKIFDTNRETIKLTISPLKLPKTPAIFESAAVDEHESNTGKSRAEPEEVDFTEKLVKPPKEVAIVKPMMESKDARATHQRNRRSSPSNSQSSRTSHDRPRSPTGYRDRSRRSASRSRFSPQRRGRVRSLSVSPSRRSGGRYVSPPRRSGYPPQNRGYRSTGRRSRSRSRSRSMTRLSGGRRGGELSPPSRRRRQAAVGQPYRKQRSVRDSRSRSPRSPGPAGRHRSPRPHSPRSPRSPPPASRRRSYSRDRYSRSPLPFKPPSPPMRRSLSPLGGRRLNSLSPPRSQMRRSRSLSRSRSPRMPRSPRSPPPMRYEEHRHRREGSYERRSLSPEHYYGQESPSMSGSYYYNDSPNRISLDARINIVLNAPPSSQESPGAGSLSSYEGYTSYSQYSGAAYMSVPPNSGHYYANQYVQMSSGGLTPPTHGHHQMYSNIPTIGSGGIPQPQGHGHPPNFYYNEFPGHPTGQQQQSSVLKELPKATVAVQKGNVLEIVPSNELLPLTKAGEPPTKPAKPKSAAVSWKEEFSNRQVTAAVLRLSREKNGSSRSILKNADTGGEAPIPEEKSLKKKVYFEDGIFPNRDSDDEDRKIIESTVRNKLRRLRKQRGITIPGEGLIDPKTEKKKEIKIDPALEKLPPPPPPQGMVAPHLDQPIYLRPVTPTPLLYFHFDPVVHSMYVSQLERPIPPRLLNPKCLPPGALVGVPPHNVAVQSPSHAQSPTSALPHMHNAKKDLNTLAALNRSTRTERTSPAAMVTGAGQRRESPATHLKVISTMDLIHHNEQGPPPSGVAQPPNMSKGHFQAIATHSPQMGVPPTQRQASPIGFVGMRINNFMRLPPSPLTRGAHPPPNNHGPAPIPVIGVRHTYNVPPPSMLPPLGGVPAMPSSATGEFSPPPQQHQYLHHHNTQYPTPAASTAMPMGQHIPTTTTAAQMTPPPGPTQPQPAPHQLPYVVQMSPGQQRPPVPNYFIPHAPGLAPPTMRHAINTTGEGAGTNTTVVKCESPQAMVAPFNVKKP